MEEMEQITLRRSIIFLIMKVAIIILIGWGVFTCVFGLGIVSGEDMYPRLRDGDLVLYYRLDREPALDSVVTFCKNKKRYYGRVVARNGDTVDMSDMDQLLINGNIQEEQIFYPTSKEERTDPLPRILADGEFYVLGDYRTEAIDSREFGPVTIEEIDGTVIALIRRRGL